MIYTTAIVSADQEQLKPIVDLINSNRKLKLTSTFDDASEIFAKELPDILFVILKEGFPPLKVIKMLQSFSIFMVLISPTASLALSAWDLEVDDFVVLPLTEDRLDQSVEKFIKKEDYLISAMIDDYFFVSHADNEKYDFKIFYKDISMIESEKNYQQIHTVSGSVFRVRITMIELNNKLGKIKDFMRVHRSFVISLRQIENVDHNSVKVSGVKKRVPIGDVYKNDFDKFLDKKTIARKIKQSIKQSNTESSN